MTDHLKDVLDFLVVTVFFKYVFVHGIADIINKVLKRVFKFILGRLINTRRELAIYLHYRNHGRGPHR